MAKNDNGKNVDVKKMDKDMLLKAFIDKFGIGSIVKDTLGGVNADMTYSEFVTLVADKGIEDVVNDMTLHDLFGMKREKADTSALKDKIQEMLAAGGLFSVKEIAEKVSEDPKLVGICLSALKKAGSIVSEGEKRSTKYHAVAK